MVASAGRGVVILAGSVRIARAALAGRDAVPTIAFRQIEDLTTATRAAMTVRDGCITAYAVGLDLEPTTGETFVLVKGEPRGERLAVAGRSFLGIKVGGARVSGPRVRAALSYSPPEAARADTFLGPAGFQPGKGSATVYRCP